MEALVEAAGAVSLGGGDGPGEKEIRGMAEETIISWTPANWITVLLMVALGFTILGAVAKIYQQRQQSSGS